jgi:hypothetical protein
MGTEKQEKHTVSITFLFTSEGHKAIWEPCFSGRLAFSQGQIPDHTGKVWSKTFASVPWSFFTRPDVDSHRQGPTAGSNSVLICIRFLALSKMFSELHLCCCMY